MKRFLSIILCLMMCVALSACGGNGGNTGNTGGEVPGWEDKKMLTVDEILETYSKSRLKCDEYSLGKYMTEIWNSQVVYNETAMFFRDKDGNIADKTMLFEIAKVLEVRNNTLDILYEEGVDYEVKDGKLCWKEGSSIHVTDYNDYFLDAPNNEQAAFSSVKEEGKYYYYSEGDYFTSKQVSVTYIRTEEWAGPEIVYDSNKLPKTQEKLKNGEPLNIVFYGDSIMEGCNASSFNNVAPYMPKLSTLISKKLASYYSNLSITEINTAKGGWTTNEGVASNNFTARVLNNNPDLVIITFGANDATWKLSAQTFGTNLQTMMNRVLAQNADAEFVLISSPMPNTDALNASGNNMAGNITEYIPVMEALSEGENVAFADMNTLSSYVLSKKDWVDITANNINHPNDFMIRLIAQLVVSKLCPAE